MKRQISEREELGPHGTALSERGIRVAEFPYLLFDLDGSIYSGGGLYPGVVPLVARLKQNGHKLVYISNNSTENSRQISEKLNSLGLPTDPAQILPATELVGKYLSERYGRAKAVVLGSDSLERAVEEHGHELVPLDGREPSDALVVGRDLSFDYSRLTLAARVVMSGAEIVAANPDMYHPAHGGDRVPETGSLVAAISAICGNPAVTYLGKPETFFFRELSVTFGIASADCVVIGDGAYTDIAGAHAYGIKSIWISHGQDFPEDLECKPDLTISSIAELNTYLQ